MKMKFNRSLSAALLALTSFIGLSSCSEDFPTNVESDKYTDLKSIRIVNAGASGTEVLEGVIDEDKKTISFPRLDTLTDFDNVKFEAVTSEGASLEKEVVSIPFTSGDAQREIIVKVVNSPRFKEYKALIRFKVPVYGADFSNPSIFDFSNNAAGNPIYPAYVSALTRGGAFDGEYVLVPSRSGGTNPHLLKVSDLKNGVINKLDLNTTGISGGTLAIQTGAFANGNLYVFNVSSTAVGFKIYFYEDYKNNYNKAPKVITVPVSDLPLATNSGRFGENTSVNLDENGDGYIFMPDNATRNILRLKIANYTEVVEKSILPLPNSAITFGLSYNQIGTSAQYLVTSYNAPMYLMSDAGSVTTTIPVSVFEASAAGAHIFNFNNERYLTYMTAGVNNASVTVFKVFNITKGKTVEEAIEYFAAQSDLEKKPVFEFALNGSGNAAPITHVSYKVVKDASGKDSKLLLYTTATDAGFSIFEFGVNVAED